MATLGAGLTTKNEPNHDGDSLAASHATRHLGKLTSLDPRKVWPNEAANFTPWLLKNAEYLGEALGIELELSAAEHPVGGFSLDLIGEDKSHGVKLIVENQLGDSDHSHLGQLLTYAAGTDASTVVWITTGFRDEHRQAITWLNEHTDESTQFFAVELQVVIIGQSEPAPLFKVVAEPNDWGKSVKAAETGALSVRAQLYREFWARYLNVLNSRHGDWTRATPTSSSSCWVSARQSGCGYVSAFDGVGGVRHELYIEAPLEATSRALFDELKAHREEIQTRYGSRLIWNAVDGRKGCRIFEGRSGDVSKTDEHEEYIEFFVEAGERLRAAIGPYLASAAAAAAAATATLSDVVPYAPSDV